MNKSLLTSILMLMGINVWAQRSIINLKKWEFSRDRHYWQTVSVPHDWAISGPFDNRGIFCDDGTVNTTITGNRVQRVANSWCIDLRRVLSVETRPDSKIRRVNVGNRIEKNQIDGRIRFEQR